MLNVRDLTHTQRSAANIICHYQKVAIFMKPGSGKTATTLYALDYLKPKATLIVAPPFVCETVWQYEHLGWEELRNKKAIWLRGDPKSRIKMLSEPCDFHIISYGLLSWLNKVTNVAKRWDALVFDEVCMLQSPGSERFKSIRQYIDHIPISVGLTGTPTGNSMLGMWSQVYACVGSETPLGDTHQVFKQRYFIQGGFKNYNWLPTKNTYDDIMRDLNGYAYSFKLEKEYCPINTSSIRLKLTQNVQREYDKLKKEFYIELHNGDHFHVLNPSGINMKLRQMEAGAVYTDEGIEEFHTLRMEALNSLVNELDGAPLIVCYEFKFQRWQLQQTFGDRVVTNMGQDTINAWNKGRIEILAVNPKSCGHGLNLQHGGCDMLFLSAPWSLRLWEQTIGRIYRTGQKKSVSIYHFSGFEIEDRVIKNLKAHKEIDNRIFEDLKHAA